MLNLVKDTFNPLNWIKLILQPKKIKIVFDRVFYYPGLRFGYSKSKLYRNFVIKFTIFLAKRLQRCINRQFYMSLRALCVLKRYQR